MADAIQLPFPPSVNAAFTNRRGGRAKTDRYNAWIYEAGVELVRQRPAKHIGAVEVEITVALPDKRTRDIDNLCKAPLDLLVRHQVIQDDNINFLKKLTIQLGQGFEGLLVRVLPWATEPEVSIEPWEHISAPTDRVLRKLATKIEEQGDDNGDS